MNRILLVTDIFPPDIGGPATFIEQLGYRLTGDGHEVTVVCTSTQVHESSDSERPFRVRRILRRPRSVLNSLWIRALLMQEVMRHRWILINGLEYPAYQACSLLNRGYVLKVVSDRAWETAWNSGLTGLSVSEFQTVDPAGQPWERLARQRDQFALKARVVLTPSEYLRQIVIGWGVKESRAITVLNGIPLEEFVSLRPRRRREKVFEVVFAGRLINIKGVDTLLKAAAALEDVHVTIVGDGPELPALETLARRIGLGEWVAFVGRRTREETQQYIANAHVLVLVSSHEGLSHTLLEAIASGVPCIASDRGGNPEIIQHGKNGYLVPYGDVEQLKLAIRYLRDNEDVRYQLAIDAKETSRRFDFRKTVEQTAAVLLST